jgi:hypothetical protein
VCTFVQQAYKQQSNFILSSVIRALIEAH